MPGLERFDVVPWMSQYLTTWSSHPRQADLHLTIDHDEPLYIEAHPVLLAELLNNLLDNAIKYSRPGSPIVVRASADQSEVQVTVEDKGTGMQEHELPLAFEPFFRSAQVSGSNGVGLGLAIASRLAKAFGGKISAQSRSGEGSKFAVHLPRAAEPVLTQDSNAADADNFQLRLSIDRSA